MKITEQFTVNNPCYKRNRRIKVRGLMLHSIGTPQENPGVMKRVFDKDGMNACVHGFVGENDAVITLPCLKQAGQAHRAWHCGGSGNDTHIGIEMCEPKNIRYTGGSTFACDDLQYARAFVEKTTENAVLLFAKLCKLHGLNPLTDIVSHAEGHKRGIASNHGDPDHLWRGLGMQYGMDKFRRDVAAEMEEKMTQADFDKMFISAMNRYMEKKNSEGPSAYSAEARSWAEKIGVIRGDKNGLKRYKAYPTREEVVEMLKRMEDGKNL